MRSVHHRSSARLSRTLAVSAALALAGCGAGESGTETIAGTPTPAAPADPGTEYKGINDDGTIDLMQFKPFELPLEGEAELEEPKGAQPTEAAVTFPEEVKKAMPSVPNLPAEDPILGRPLVINGTVVPFDEIKKQICFGNIGSSEVADARIRIFVEEERKRLASIGASSDRMELAPTELQDYLKVVEDNLKQEYPDGSISMDDLYKGLSSSDPMAKLRTQMEFSKLYMPDDPEQFPPSTLEAILKQEGGQAVLDHFKQSWEVRKNATEPVPKDPAQLQFEGAIMQQVLAHLMEVATIAFEPEAGVLYRVNGVDIRTDDIWNRIKDRVTRMEVLKAKQWIVNTRLLEDNLKAAGAWLDDQEASDAYFAHSDPFRDSIFSIERIALMVKQFPSIEYYKQYHRLLESFKRMKTPTEEELNAFAEKRTKKIVGQVSVDVDVILCSAFDFRSNSWKENGWADAEDRMRDVVTLLVDEQRPWDELLERYSDFWEPPKPASQQGFAQSVTPNQKGRFRNVQRNGLLGRLGESDYDIFLSGSCVTDFVFFEQEVTSLGKPMRGPYGWYLPRLLKRTKAPSRLPMDENTLGDLIRDDYYTCGLSDFAQELIAKNEVFGLEMPGR